MEDEKGTPNRYLVLGREEPQYMGQGGIKERLLCKNCEVMLSVYEKYAKEILYGGNTQIAINPIAKKSFEISNIDYHKFKIFQLSILWRASVSKDEFFEDVQLGPHEKTLRKMITDENPGKESDYPCVMIRIVDDKREAFGEFMVDTMSSKFKGHRIYTFVFGYFTWNFIASSHQKPKEFIKYALRENGSFRVLDFELTQMEKVFDLFKSVFGTK